MQIFSFYFINYLTSNDSTKMWLMWNNQSINPILIRVYPRKWGRPDLPHSNSYLSNSHSPSCLIHGIFLLQTNTLALLLHLYLPHLLSSSSLPFALHFKLQCFSKTYPLSLLNTCPYHLTPFASAIWITVSFNLH